MEETKSKSKKKKIETTNETVQTEWKEQVIQVRRVTKVVKGGKKLSFREKRLEFKPQPLFMRHIQRTTFPFLLHTVPCIMSTADRQDFFTLAVLKALKTFCLYGQKSFLSDNVHMLSLRILPASLKSRL